MTLASELQSLWRKSRYKLYHPSNWRKLLFLRRHYDLTILRPKDVSVSEPHGLAPDCDNCTFICCTGVNSEVSLRFLDIAKLIDANLQDYITHERIVPKSLRPFTTTSKTAARQDLLNSVYGKIFPVLKRDKYGSCKLLDDNLKCTAWPNWPLSCARYPYALSVQNRAIFYAKGCRSTKVLPYKLASPKTKALVYAALEGYNERIRDIILLHVAKKELENMGLLKYLKTEKLDGNL